MPNPIAGVAKAVVKKLAKDAAKKSAVKANARGLKAAQGKSLASPVKKAAAKKNTKERVMVKRIAEANKGMNMKEPYATKDAMRKANEIRAMKKKPLAKGSASRGSAKEIARIATIAGGSALGITSTKEYKTGLKRQLKDAEKEKQFKKNKKSK